MFCRQTAWIFIIGTSSFEVFRLRFLTRKGERAKERTGFILLNNLTFKRERRVGGGLEEGCLIEPRRRLLNRTGVVNSLGIKSWITVDREIKIVILKGLWTVWILAALGDHTIIFTQSWTLKEARLSAHYVPLSTSCLGARGRGWALRVKDHWSDNIPYLSTSTYISSVCVDR